MRNQIHKVCNCIGLMAMALIISFLIPVSVFATATPAPATDIESENAKERIVCIFIENYNSEYDVYEESMASLYYIYANVENGGFTSDPVTVDIPANLTYILERDGVEIPYVANNEISSPGNYVLRVEAEEETLIYESSFRFSIRPKEEIVNEQTPVEIDPNATDEEDADSEDKDEDTDTSETEEEVTIYDSGDRDYIYGAAGAYEYHLASGDIIYSNIPSGSIVNGYVEVSIPESMVVKVYRNDEEIEAAEKYEEAGSYRIEMSDNSVEYALNYGMKKISFAFRIVDEEIADMQYFNVPKGFVITQVIKDDVEVELSPLNLFCYKMEEDGEYIITYTDKQIEKSFSTKIFRDTVGPMFNMTIKNGKATIAYVSDDVAKVELNKDGVDQEDFSQTKIVGKGNYILEVTDRAGNMTQVKFALGKSINGATVTSIIILLLIIGGAVYVVRYNKKNMSVR